MELTLTGGSTLSDHTHSRQSSSAPLHNANGSGDGVNSANNGSSQNQAAAASTTQQQQQGSSHSHHNHGHSHNHGQQQQQQPGQCCNAHAPPPAPRKIDASTLLPTKEVVQQFKTNKIFRLNVLSNVIRGGPYKLFTNLVTVLVLDDEKKKAQATGTGSESNDAVAGSDKDKEEQQDDDAILEKADPESLASFLNGYGADGHTLAHWCAKRGDEPRFLSFLISKSFNGARLLVDLHMPSKDSVGMYPLHWAVTEGAIPLVNMMLQHLEERPSPSPQRRPSSSVGASTPSSLMQDEGDLVTVTMDGSSTINPSNNVGIDARDTSGCTPLLIASQYGHPDLAAFLIRRGADAHAVDSSRDTALHWAAYKGSVEVCGMLLHLLGTEGVLDNVDAFGQTPLHLASLRGNTETVRFLMEEAGSVGEIASGGGSLDLTGRVGSKVNRSSRASFMYPSKLLSMHDKEEKTPRDLAIKKKKLGCELLLLEYEEQYLLPKRSILSRCGQTFRDLCSIQSWKAWMGMGGFDLPIGQSPTFPFYWMTSHILIGGMVYATQFVGLGFGKLTMGDSLLLDKFGLHLFYVVALIMTCVNLYYVYTTNPGVIAPRRDDNGNNALTSPATCQLLCFSKKRGGYPTDKISMEMDRVYKELRGQYDDIIESYATDFPSQEKRVPLCHTCRIVKPLRSKHCRVARRCVLLFDHHCPFVGTTIGLYNYLYFYLFLLSFCLMEVGFITTWIIFMKRTEGFPKGAFLMGGYLALYLVPVAFMAFYHTTLMMSNMSTNEQLNLRKYKYFWDSGRFHNPFNRGRIQNILHRCWPDRSLYELGNEPKCNAGCCGDIEMKKNDEERQPMLSNVV